MTVYTKKEQIKPNDKTKWISWKPVSFPKLTHVQICVYSKYSNAWREWIGLNEFLKKQTNKNKNKTKKQNKKKKKNTLVFKVAILCVCVCGWGQVVVMVLCVGRGVSKFLWQSIDRAGNKKKLPALMWTYSPINWMTLLKILTSQLGL